jgi:flagellar hook protein FlgE
MLRSLFTGISGLRAHQTMLDVTGNNIANVNTTGFKSSSVQFQDTLSQLLQGATAAQPNAGLGGSNPAQVGLGVKLAGITTNFTQGASQMTGRSTDMMIQGDGFFVVSKGANQYFTRAGNFDFDSNGNMVLPGEGAMVQGWVADINGVVDPNGPLVNIQVQVGATMAPKVTQVATFAGNLDAETADGVTFTRPIQVYDADGFARELEVTFTRNVNPNALPNPIDQWTIAVPDDPASTPITVTFDPTGNTPNFGGQQLQVSLNGGASMIDIDLIGLTGYAGTSTLRAMGQDGHSAGVLQSFSLGNDGTITGSFSNGYTQTLGQIALANFTNPTGLMKSGGSLFAATINSGNAQLGPAGQGGRGSLAGGALEMSNVDLSAEFTNLIVAQRGFQANSRVITTSDEVLQELVNLKR